MKVALVGNPNCGKTTLFNRLCGQSRPVGNRIGVTVDIAEGEFFDGKIYDLPGIYDIKNRRNEEKIASDFLLQKSVDLVINVVDSTHLCRSLFLTTRLINEKLPVVVALNLTDEANRKGIAIDCKSLSDLLGCPVYAISARKDKEFEKLFTVPPVSNAAFPSDAASCYEKLEEIYQKTVTLSKKSSFSLDKILLHRYLALPVFVITVCLLLSLCAILSEKICDLSDVILKSISDRLSAYLLQKFSKAFTSLICDGVLLGAGSVLKFLPQVALLTFALCAMEDCGYLSRVAYITDRLFASLGMSGRTSVSLILGSGCTVPAVMSTRTIPDDSERKKCLSCLHLIPCSAKLPLFSMLITAFFPNKFFILPATYLISVIAVIAVNFFFGEKIGGVFIMEMPDLKRPSMRVCLSLTWSRMKDFIFRTCTVVFLSSIVVWVLINFNFGFRLCDINDSMLCKICNAIKYAFYPAGLTSWQSTAGVLVGFAGKESVVGVLNIVSNGNISEVFSIREGIVFYLFMLFSSPCAAALSALKKELGTWDFLFCLLRQIVLAYFICGIVNLILSVAM